MANQKTAKPESREDVFFFKNVRCSYPHLFGEKFINNRPSKKGAKLLIDPATQKDVIIAVRNRIRWLIENKLEMKSLQSHLWCLRNGEESDKEEEDGYWTLSANCQPDRPPIVLDHERRPVTSQEQNKIYGGCYVNAKIELWVQNHREYGKRINATLHAIQFFKDGESFGAGLSTEERIDGFETFDDIGEESANMDALDGNSDKEFYDDDDDI